MKNKLLWTFIFTLLFGMIISPKTMKAQSAEGFDPADEMYIKADTDHYWKGRYSNGRVFAEYIAKEVAGDYDNLTNYAVGGAFSGDMANTEEEQSNWSSWLKGWGGVEQTEKFLTEMNGEADPEALYIISIGGNDTYAIENLGVERTADLSSDYSLEMVQNLVEGGAKYILLPNRFEDQRKDLTDFDDLRNQQVVQKVEDYLAQDSTPDDVEVIYGHNQQLRENIDEQGFENFGYKSMGFYLVSDWVPAYGYGLASEDNSDIFPTSEAEDFYGAYGQYSTDSEYYNPEAADWEPDDFYTYDEYHLSNRSQKHLATYLLNSDIHTDDGDGTFEQVYNGEVSGFAEAIADGTIPSDYTTVYTFGDSSIDTGRGLEVTTELVENRGKPKVSSYVVTNGDNLWNIAKENYHGEQTNAQILKEVQAIYQANQDQIQNPDLIFPNQTITLPKLDDSKRMK
ncbi:SGNH/GDSL hydrolase family protein [Oceanobacillus timonensis]|uniref:SGNH/GDSL hydrolase family protein n=1 Tax=Oceanobacillus timonensis TaxID=1926285 RepID=UPI0009B9B62D|nr:SGNH/GDSL hydrolase family protein [Oceanobacillus timonensis]